MINLLTSGFFPVRCSGVGRVYQFLSKGEFQMASSKKSVSVVKAKKKSPAGRKAGKQNVDLHTFLKMVMEADKQGFTQTWVAEQLDITPAAVSTRCKLLRDKGVTLPEFARGNAGPRIDVDAANDLIKSLRKA
jgi:hypothetical protein